MDTTSVQKRTVGLDDVFRVLGLAQPTQRLFLYLYKKEQQWPGVAHYEKFEVIQQEAKLSDLDFANALDELLKHRIAIFNCADDQSVNMVGVANRLRHRFIHDGLDETMKLNVAVIQFSWDQTTAAVRRVWEEELREAQERPEEQGVTVTASVLPIVASTPDTATPHTAIPLMASPPSAGAFTVGDAEPQTAASDPVASEIATSEVATAYRLVFRSGKPIRIAEGEAPPPEKAPPPEVKPQAEQSEEADVTNEARKAGWVYVLRVGRNYKIGKTINLNQRMTQLRIQLPEKPEVIHTIQTNDIDWVEHHWHRCFAARRKNGEWFRLMPNEVDELKSIKRMDVER